jgi:hypothetical protein
MRATSKTLTGIVAGFVLASFLPAVATAADPPEPPLRIQISNVTNSSFSVHWFTANACTGSVVYGKSPDSLTGNAYDIRERTSGFTVPEVRRKVHYVTASGLSERSTYFFKINSGGGQYAPPGPNICCYIVTTGSPLAGAPKDVEGFVWDADGNPVLVAEAGDSDDQVTSWGFSNVNVGNVNVGAGPNYDWKLYWTLTGNATTNVVKIYTDTAHTALVASTESVDPSNVHTLKSENSSGLTGKVKVTWKNADEDAGNILTLKECILTARIREKHGTAPPSSTLASYFLYSGSRWLLNDTAFRKTDGSAYFPYYDPEGKDINDPEHDALDLYCDGGALGTKALSGSDSISTWYFANTPSPGTIDVNLSANTPTPQVTSVTPSWGENNNVTDVVISGHNFMYTSGVSLLPGPITIPPTSWIVDSDSTIRATIQVGISPAIYDVIVTVSGGGGSSAASAGSKFEVKPIQPKVIVSGSTTKYVASSALLTHTFSHTVPTGSNGLLAVGISINAATAVSNVTYKGETLSNLDGSSNPMVVANNPRVEIWTLRNPDVGTNDIVITISGSTARRIICGAINFNGVNQDKPLGIFSSDTAANEDLDVSASVTSSSEELVFDTLVTRGTTYSLQPNASQNQRWLEKDGTYSGCGSTKGGAATTTMTWTWNDDGAGDTVASLAVVPIKPAGSQTAPPGGGSWTSVGTMNIPRAMHQLTSLGDGKVLATGGHDGDVPGGTGALNSVELYDIATNTWTTMRSFTLARYGHRAVLLDSNHVMIIGGFNAYNEPTTTVEIYDISANQWSCAPSLNTPRAGHSATMISGGKVLVAGGEGLDMTIHKTLEVYDGTWHLLPARMTVARAYHSASIADVSNNTVLLTGGATLKDFNKSDVTTFTIPHTVLSSTNRLLLVGITTTNNVSVLDNGVFFGSSPMTREIAQSNTGGPRVEIWSLENPTVGTFDVSITLSGSATVASATAVSYASVNYTTGWRIAPVGNTGTSSAVSVSMPSTTKDQVIFDVAAATNSTDGIMTPGSEQAVIYMADSDNKMLTGSSNRLGASDAAVSWTFTTSSGKSTIAAIGIKPKDETDVTRKSVSNGLMDVTTLCDKFDVGGSSITKLNNMASPRMSHQSVYLSGAGAGGSILVIGGWDGVQPTPATLKSCELLASDYSGAWVAGPDMTDARADAQAVATGITTALVIGGWTAKSADGETAIQGLAWSEAYTYGSPWATRVALSAATWEGALASVNASTFVRSGGWVYGSASRKAGDLVGVAGVPSSLTTPRALQLMPPSKGLSKPVEGDGNPQAAEDIVASTSSELIKATSGGEEVVASSPANDNSKDGPCFASVVGGAGALSAALGLLALAFVVRRKK